LWAPAAGAATDGFYYKMRDAREDDCGCARGVHIPIWEKCR